MNRHLCIVTIFLLAGCVRPNDRYIPNDLAPETAQCSSMGIPMVVVERGFFMMGSSGGEPNEKPVHEQRVLDFSMDVTEVTVAQYSLCVDEGFCTIPAKGDNCNWGIEGHRGRPVNCVSKDQAERFCAWRCLRLPTEIEWEYAARGLGSANYPWGNDAPQTAGKAFTQICTANETCDVGQFAGTLLGSPQVAGAKDLAGNVWEWTSSPGMCAYPLDRKNPDCGLAKETVRVARGGYVFNLPASSLRSAYRLLLDPAAQAGYVGFRCAVSL